MPDEALWRQQPRSSEEDLDAGSWVKENQRSPYEESLKGHSATAVGAYEEIDDVWVMTL